MSADSPAWLLVYSRLPMKNIKAMLVDTLKVHEYDVFALRPLDIQTFNELYETICGLSLLCNDGRALTATNATPLGGGATIPSTSSSGDGTGAGSGAWISGLDDERRATAHYPFCFCFSCHALSFYLAIPLGQVPSTTDANCCAWLTKRTRYRGTLNLRRNFCPCPGWCCRRWRSRRR